MLRGGRGRARVAVGGGMCSTCRANCEYYLHCAAARFPLRGKIEREKEIFMNREGGICAGLFSCPQSLDYGLLLCVCMILSLSVISA